MFPIFSFYLKPGFCLSPKLPHSFSGSCGIFPPDRKNMGYQAMSLLLIPCFITRRKACQHCVPPQAVLVGVTGVHAVLNVLLGLHSSSSGVKLWFQLGHEVANCWYVCGIVMIFKMSVVCQVALLYF